MPLPEITRNGRKLVDSLILYYRANVRIESAWLRGRQLEATLANPWE